MKKFRIVILLLLGILLAVMPFVFTAFAASGRGTCGGGPCGAYTDGTEVNGFVVDTDANLVFKSGTSATERLRVTSTGSLGLGTSTPRSSVDFSTKTDALMVQTASAAAGASCTGYTGGIRYNSNLVYIEFCNGTTWQAMVAQQAIVAPTAPSGAGYLVVTTGSFDGNLGGLTGANAKCVTDLTTNTSWSGYADASSRGLLNSSKIFAFMCSGAGGCINLNPLTQYYFSNTENAGYGGGSFYTDSSSQGPYTSSAGTTVDTTLWNVASRFGAAYSYWSSRTSVSCNAAAFTNTFGSGCGNASDCSTWTTASSASNGYNGSSSGSGYLKHTGNVSTCDQKLRLLCMVNP